MKNKKKVHSYELWQGGIRVVVVEAPTATQATKEINHYIMQYAQDGPVVVKKRKPNA